MRESHMQELVGKLVTGLSVSKGEEWLVFHHGEHTTMYTTDAGCCSETWFADITGVKTLLGEIVLSAEVLEVPDIQDERCRQDVDAFYGIKLTTAKGYVDIVFRNSSNGYYGGGLVYCGKEVLNKYYCGTGPELVSINDDWSA